MIKQWVTKLRNLTDEQMAIIPDDMIFERGEDFVKFMGAPSEFAVRMTRGVQVTTQKDTKVKSSVIKLLSAAKDADTPQVYTETLKTKA